MTRTSPWQASTSQLQSGQDLRFHVKGTWVQKLTEIMSFASSHSPNSGSSSMCHHAHEVLPGKGSGSRRWAHPPQHTMASSGVRWPSTVRRAPPTSTNTGNSTKKVGGVPTTLCGTILSFTIFLVQKGPRIHPLPARHPETTIPPTFQFLPRGFQSYPTPNFPTRSRRRGSKTQRWKVGYRVETPRFDFHLLGNRPAEVPKHDLPTPRHANFLTPAVLERTPLQQDAKPCTEYSYSKSSFPMIFMNAFHT